MTVTVFTFVLLLGNALKEMLGLMASTKVGLGVVASSIGLLVPFVWVFALPMGVLTATLLIFGRFSAEQEYTAVRASGISLLGLISPVLVLSLVLCGVCAVVNLDLGPRCRSAYTRLLFNLRTELAKNYLPEGQPITDFKDFVLYIGKNRSGQLEDIVVLQLEKETNLLRSIQARRGKMEIDQQSQEVRLTLYDSQVLPWARDRKQTDAEWFDESTLKFALGPRDKPGPKTDDLTFSELWAELRKWERLRGMERQISLPPELKNFSPEQRQAWRRDWQQRAREQIARVTRLRFQLHQQVAFSFACLGFTLVGIPLGIRAHRRETNVGIAIALLLTAVYYSFIMLGKALDSRPECFPWLIVWAPNFLFQAVGAVLLWRANRGL
jgi:lipopolysaccharide export system permease protein